MTAARSFTDLQFWQRARAWSKEIFHLTQRAPFSRDRRLVVQINDSSESVMANMAEGFGRATQEQFILFLGYALGSLDEAQSHLCAAYDRGYIDKDEFSRLYRDGVTIRKLTVAFIRAMVMPRSGVRDLGARPNFSNQVWEIYERVSGKPRPELFRQPVQEAPPPRNDEPPA